MHATCWAQQCCDVLRWHVAIVWPRLNAPFYLQPAIHSLHFTLTTRFLFSFSRFLSLHRTCQSGSFRVHLTIVHKKLCFIKILCPLKYSECGTCFPTSTLSLLFLVILQQLLLITSNCFQEWTAFSKLKYCIPIVLIKITGSLFSF